MHPGLIGGIAGSVIGVMGGAIGTYFSIRNTGRPRERALMIRLSVLAWLWIAALMAWLFLMPRPWNQAAFLLNLPLLLSIPRWNRRLALARAEDKSAS
jgi:hypothetical protein